MCQSGSPKRNFRSHFEDFSGTRVKSENRCYVGESSFWEVDGTLKGNFLGVVFDTCLGIGLEDDIFMEFDDFGVHLGFPGETILGHLLEKN